MRASSSLAPLALALGLLSSKAAAIAFVLPADGTVWDQTGATSNVISWSLWPLTYPTPTSPLFDIYIRNYGPGMYSPGLNTTLALSVDASLAIDTYLVEIAADLLPGPNYQLFFSEPGNAELVYADSAVFCVGTCDMPTTGTVSTSYDFTGSTSAISSITTSTAMATATSSTTDAGLTTSAMVTSFVSSTSAPTATATSTKSSTSNAAATGGISAAPIIGGPADQGLYLLSSGAEGSRRGMGAVAGGVLAGAVAIAWLF